MRANDDLNESNVSIIQSMFWNAIKTGDERIVGSYLRALNYKERDKLLNEAHKSLSYHDPLRSLTPLILAAQFKQAHICRLLLAAGADPDIAGLSHLTALFHAVFNKSTECCQVLLEAKPDLSLKSLAGTLSSAVISGQEPIVSLLIQAGISVNTIDQCGSTALINAAMHGRIDILNSLIKAGANINFINLFGDSALLMAFKFKQISVINELLKCPYLNVDFKNTKGENAYDLAIQNELFDQAAKIKAISIENKKHRGLVQIIQQETINSASFFAKGNLPADIRTLVTEFIVPPHLYP